MQTNVILTGSAVPNAYSAFSAPLQITPSALNIEGVLHSHVKSTESAGPEVGPRWTLFARSF